MPGLFRYIRPAKHSNLEMNEAIPSNSSTRLSRHEASKSVYACRDLC